MEKRFYRRGDSGRDVMKIQNAIQRAGVLDKTRDWKSSPLVTLQVDGDFGPATEAAVIHFQLSKGLNGDGVVGPQTLRAMGIEDPTYPFIIPVPNGKKELVDTFGDPLESGYWDTYAGFCKTPSELCKIFTYKFAGDWGFWCNKMVIPAFHNVFKEIVLRKLHGHLDSFDGCQNIRYVRGSSKKLSTHSWGIAAKTNAIGAEPKMDSRVVACFEKFGFVWGGNFQRKDGMHFQYVKGY